MADTVWDDFDQESTPLPPPSTKKAMGPPPPNPLARPATAAVAAPVPKPSVVPKTTVPKPAVPGPKVPAPPAISKPVAPVAPKVAPVPPKAVTSSIPPPPSRPAVGAAAPRAAAPPKPVVTVAPVVVEEPVVVAVKETLPSQKSTMKQTIDRLCMMYPEKTHNASFMLGLLGVDDEFTVKDIPPLDVTMTVIDMTDVTKVVLPDGKMGSVRDWSQIPMDAQMAYKMEPADPVDDATLFLYVAPKKPLGMTEAKDKEVWVYLGRMMNRLSTSFDVREGEDMATLLSTAEQVQGCLLSFNHITWGSVWEKTKLKPPVTDLPPELWWNDKSWLSDAEYNKATQSHFTESAVTNPVKVPGVWWSTPTEENPEMSSMYMLGPNIVEKMLEYHIFQWQIAEDVPQWAAVPEALLTSEFVYNSMWGFFGNRHSFDPMATPYVPDTLLESISLTSTDFITLSNKHRSPMRLRALDLILAQPTLANGQTPLEALETLLLRVFGEEEYQSVRTEVKTEKDIFNQKRRIALAGAAAPPLAPAVAAAKQIGRPARPTKATPTFHAAPLADDEAQLFFAQSMKDHSDGVDGAEEEEEEEEEEEVEEEVISSSDELDAPPRPTQPPPSQPAKQLPPAKPVATKQSQPAKQLPQAKPGATKTAASTSLVEQQPVAKKARVDTEEWMQPNFKRFYDLFMECSMMIEQHNHVKLAFTGTVESLRDVTGLTTTDFLSACMGSPRTRELEAAGLALLEGKSDLNELAKKNRAILFGVPASVVYLDHLFKHTRATKLIQGLGIPNSTTTASIAAQQAEVEAQVVAAEEVVPETDEPTVYDTPMGEEVDPALA